MLYLRLIPVSLIDDGILWNWYVVLHRSSVVRIEVAHKVVLVEVAVRIHVVGSGRYGALRHIFMVWVVHGLLHCILLLVILKELLIDC